jgi:hypothetical protein
MRLALAGFALVLATAPLMAQEGRTFIDRLPLDTPQEAVSAFIEAFNAKDYALAYYMMTPEARQTFVDSYYAYNAGRYFKLDDTGFVAGSLLSESDISEGELAEVGSDTALIFDNIVFHADQNGEMPFSLAGAKAVQVEDGDSDTQATVVIEGGEPARILIDAVLLYNGDWRIDRIHWAGSDAAQKPWGLTTGKVKNR